MAQWLWAAFWGGVAGSALLIGALASWLVRVPRRGLAAVMAFGSGVLISALAFDLMDEAYIARSSTASPSPLPSGSACCTAAS